MLYIYISNKNQRILAKSHIIIYKNVFAFVYFAIEFLADLTYRCRVPFNGITAVLHTNIEPDFNTAIYELSGCVGLREGMKQFAVFGEISKEFVSEMEMALDRLREEFRFTELLRLYLLSLIFMKIVFFCSYVCCVICVLCLI